MSSQIFNSPKSHQESKTNDIPEIKESLFNSKLFIDLDSTEDSDSSDKSTDDIDSILSDNNKHLLSNELIEEINSINECKCEYTNKFNTNPSNILCAPPFFPSVMLNQMNQNIPLDIIMNQNKIGNVNFGNKFSSNKKKYGKKGEWICFFCHNLNYGFRTVCNRCKEAKSKSECFCMINTPPCY